MQSRTTSILTLILQQVSKKESQGSEVGTFSIVILLCSGNNSIESMLLRKYHRQQLYEQLCARPQLHFKQ